VIYSEQNDNILVTLTLMGNQNAYEALVIRYQKAVIASAYSVVQNTYMAEDAAQDAFVSAWMELDMLREADKYGAWVCRIAKNCAKNMLVRFREYLDLDIFLNYEYEHGESLEESLIASGNYDLLHESINGLSDKVKKVIELHYFEGLSISEIADRLRISAGTVKRQLYDGRTKIRKDLYAMNENENDTLVEKVMKKVRELGMWRFKDNKNDFEEAYNDVLTDIGKLPESGDKSWALADVLMHGWWWLPGKKSDELFARIKNAAIDGKNDTVMEFIIGTEDGKLSGKDKIEFMLNRQIPFLKENGFAKSIGREWFWLGYEYFKIKDYKAGFAAFDNVLSILEPSDVYYANVLSAIEIEKRALEKYKDTDENVYNLNAIAEEYRFIDGDLRMWSQPGYGKGMLQSVNGGANYIFYNAARCNVICM